MQGIPELTVAEKAALIVAIKAKDATIVKQSLPTGSHPVDFTVRLSGVVQRGVDAPSSTGETAATVDLTSPAVMFELLRRLGVDPKEVRRKLVAMLKKTVADKAASFGAHSVPAESEYAEVFKDVAAKTAEKLPRQKTFASGKSGSTTGAINIVRV